MTHTKKGDLMQGSVIAEQNTLLMDNFHRQKGAKMIPFGAWEVPAYYTSIIDEHTCTREAVGLFDVSHMGEIHINGKDARAFLQLCITNDCEKYDYGTAFYSALCNHAGGIIDDVFVYPVNEDTYFLIVNATNSTKDFNWLQDQVQSNDVTIVNATHERSMIALQGPKSDAVLSAACDFSAETLAYHQFTEHVFCGERIIVSASGYTGERGFEIMFNNTVGQRLWDALMAAGENHGIQPIGFGARDTLRLEAGCALYGHELNEMTTPLETNLSWIVKGDKPGGFIGKEALETQRTLGITQRLFGIAMIDRAIPREGYSVFLDNQKIGQVTSGSYLPTVKKNAGLVFVDAEGITPGTEVTIEIREKQYKATIVALPFYRSKR